MRKIFNKSLRQGWGIGVFVCFLLFTTGLPIGPKPVVAAKPALPTAEPSPLLLQGAVSPTATVPLTATLPASLQAGSSSAFNFTLADLGYDETVLVSPYDAAVYSFRLPESWDIRDNNFLVLDLSYNHSQLSAEPPSVFGELRVVLDGQVLETIFVDALWIHQPFRVELPVELLATESRDHNLELFFNADFFCGVPHKANLLVHPTTLISLNRIVDPPALNLARYPLPVYQRSSFSSDSVYFVLPSTPTETELNSAVGMAAKLGDLTSNNLPISATTDVELSDGLSSLNGGVNHHFIVLGRPQNNRMISALNQYLPVSLYQRQFQISAERPGFVAPGDVVTYTYTVSNTTAKAVTLSVASALSAEAQLQNCSPRCADGAETNTITWQNISLGPQDTLNLQLSVKASPSLTGTLFENVTTFTQAGSGPVNAATLTSTVVTTPPDVNLPQTVAYKEGDYFFAYNGRAVAETDGIIQEIISPWDKNRVILVVTGLDDLALTKAGYAMSSESKFPGMNGPVAFVEDVILPPEENQEIPAIFERTFEQLGYSDRTIKGDVIGEIEYRFNAPYGWVLDEGSFIELYFTHSQLVQYEASGLTVLINDVPVASTAFTEQSSTGGYLNVKLTNSNIRQGRVNRLTLQAILSLQDECLSQELVESRAWLIVSNQSKVRLVRNQEAKLDFNLSYYPNPFYARPDLSDLLISLPAQPVSSEWGYALRLAGSLGSSAGGKTMLPRVTAGSDLPADAELANYNIIALGQPSRNFLLRSVSAQLPLPLSPITDQPEQKLDHIKFRLPPDLQLGYIELVVSPWNESRALLTVMGAPDTGLKEAIGVLVDKPWNLEGNLSVVRDKKANNVDTRLLTSGGLNRSLTMFLETEGLAITETTVLTATPEAVASVSTSPLPAPSPQTDDLFVDVMPDEEAASPTIPVWLIPLVIATALIVIMIFSFAFWQSRRLK